MRKLLLLFCILFSQLLSFSQGDTLIYYFDKSLNSCERDKAIITGIGVKEEGKFKFNVYYTETGISLFKGWFLDSTLAVKEGFFTYYDSSGVKESEGVYHKNTETGYWMTWSGGYLADSILYKNGEKIEQIYFKHYDSSRLSRRTLINNRDNFTEITEWYPDAVLKLKSKTEIGTGIETKYYANGKVESVSNFRDGKVERIKYYNQDGTEMTKQEIAKKFPQNLSDFETLNGPSYPGGQAGFSNFFSKNFKTPKNFDSGQVLEAVTVTFYLDKAGFAYDIQVSGASNRDLEIEIATVFKRMPAWKMNGLKSFGPIIYTLSLTGN